ncbi:hypothetical protein R69658_07440 [Paraburkholderia aspalathi]|uniref:Uncharacterized protein n=1 Tax=Paraburkholderia aspalathi TaxID=1324617 RepID=A0ABM8T4B0_9BURK|nr:hypothetical protein R69658_07440 [Paraburkholderia aspalathi]
MSWHAECYGSDVKLIDSEGALPAFQLCLLLRGRKCLNGSRFCLPSQDKGT